MISIIVFVLLLAAAVGFFTYNVRKVTRNIKLGKDIDRKDNPIKRWWLVFKVAIFQSKMMGLPIAGILHVFVYAGFILVNIEMLEVMVDGFTGSHRAFSFLGQFYPIIISATEFFALLVIIGCVVFLFRRNVIRLPRFWKAEMTSWPRLDANIILITEVVLMTSVFFLNASDYILQTRDFGHYEKVGSFFLSSFFVPLIQNLPSESLVFIDRACWWLHIVGIMLFLNYIPYSKHFHVFVSFPNVYFSKLEPAGKIANMPSITREIKSMLGKPVEPEETTDMAALSFGAKDVKDLTWKGLMDAYSCTECGRCTRVCPANITGKKLSPRKVMMDARDRLEIVGKNIDKNGKDFSDEKSLFDFISTEELWACTTCNACTNECPVNIDQVSLIIEMRRYLVMEKAAAPGELNAIFSNIENNGAPWQFSQQDRLLWANELYINEK